MPHLQGWLRALAGPSVEWVADPLCHRGPIEKCFESKVFLTPLGNNFFLYKLEWDPKSTGAWYSWYTGVWYSWYTGVWYIQLVYRCMV